MAKIIPFPNMLPETKRIEQLEARLAEIESENTWIKSDIEHLNAVLEGNIHELRDILKDLAKLHKLEEPIIEFESDAGLTLTLNLTPTKRTINGKIWKRQHQLQRR